MDASAKVVMESAAATCVCGMARATVIDAMPIIAAAATTINPAARRRPTGPRLWP